MSNNLRIMFCFLFITAGCTPSYRPQGNPPQPESITHIRFKLDKNSIAGLDDNAIAPIEKDVTRYLVRVGYPLILDYPQGSEQISHILEAKIGKIKKKETPIGFSIDIGNSNPRAMDFQKARVLPVQCTLRSRRNLNEKISLFMDFLAGETFSAQGEGDTQKIDQYSNHIATVCFNLLEHLRVNKLSTNSAAEQDSWVPEIRIEEIPPTIIDKSSKNPPSATQNSNIAKPTSTESEAAAKTKPSQSNPAPHKRMIIENQGQPIILDFGYERK